MGREKRVNWVKCRTIVLWQKFISCAITHFGTDYNVSIINRQKKLCNKIQ